jgi:hypothetical protein
MGLVRGICENARGVDLYFELPTSTTVSEVKRLQTHNGIPVWLGWAYFSIQVPSPWHQGVCFDLPTGLVTP